MIKENSERGPKYKYPTKEDLQKAVDEYFVECDNLKKPYTMTSLALQLGLTRKGLAAYSHRDEYGQIVQLARQKCEAYAEECLFGGKNSGGIIFNLVNNYGWTNKQEINHGGQSDNPLGINIIMPEGVKTDNISQDD